MIAYLILVHRYPNQFKRLFKAIYHSGNHYLVHVDQRSGPALYEEIASFLADYPNGKMLPSKPALWGGYSLVDAELRGIAALLAQGLDWQFFINLSAQDFPLRSQSHIHDFLRGHQGKDFLKVADQRQLRPDTLHRIDHYVTETEQALQCEPVKKRPYLTDVTPYIGNQWMILSRAFCEFVSSSPEIERFKHFYQHTLIPDEGFFQTVIMNTSYQGQIVNDDKRAIDWIPMGDIKLRPRDYGVADAVALQQSPHLFARKFDETIDSAILDLLEAAIAPAPLSVASSRQPVLA